MPQQAKPAGENGGHRSITIVDWKPLTKNTPRGFFTAILPSGMVNHNLSVHEKGEARWIGLPAREWTDSQGVKQYTPFIKFRGRATANRFRDEVLAALERTESAASR
jgi:hypothetical protein